MKKLLLLCCVLFFAALSTIPRAHAQNPFFSDPKNSIDTLHASITKSSYLFLKGFYKLGIKFNSNGTGEQTNWKFKWHAKDAQTIEMTQLGPDGQPNGKKTIYTFTGDYSSFSGIDFDGVTKVTGQLSTAK